MKQHLFVKTFCMLEKCWIYVNSHDLLNQLQKKPQLLDLVEYRACLNFVSYEWRWGFYGVNLVHRIFNWIFVNSHAFWNQLQKKPQLLDLVEYRVSLNFVSYEWRCNSFLWAIKTNLNAVQAQGVFNLFKGVQSVKGSI